MTERHGMSQPLRRREDARFVTGRGRYTDDIDLPGQLYGSFVRSSVAHGAIRGIDVEGARATPGVVAVFTGVDLTVAGIGGTVSRSRAGRPDMAPLPKTPRPGLALDVVRHVGEPLALVVAESRVVAEDAALLVEPDIEERPAVSRISDALKPGAPIVWDTAPNNVGNVWSLGDRVATDDAFARAAHVTRLRLHNNRLLANPMEPRASLASYDRAAETFTLIASTQGVQYFAEVLCEQVFDLPRERMRVLTHDVGGGFGVKEQPMSEDIAILHAARALDRPIKWTGTRSEHFVADNHARDADIEAALALDGNGHFTALRVAVDQSMGAYLACNGVGMPLRNVPNGLAQVYRTPLILVDVRLVMTHTSAIGPYRGAGREQASYIVERLIDEAARELGCDPIALRRKNMIPPSAMPYLTPVGRVYDSGEFEVVLDKTLQLADWDGFEKRRTESAAAGKLRGRGLACYLENTGGWPHEGAKIQFAGDGRVDVVVCSQSQGQGHETSFVQVAATRLGLPFDAVRLVQGDSHAAPTVGLASTASRSMTMAGSAIAKTCVAVVDKARLAASHWLEAAQTDIEFSEGVFRVAGTDRSVGLFELADWLATAPAGYDDLPETLNSEEQHSASDQVFPNGCHVCEVEIDPDTGALEVVRYSAVDDVGVVINPTIVHGQVHGGIVQGIGQVLGEEIRYDENGQLLTGSFMDYAMPHASDQPFFAVDLHEVPCTTNPLGVKGAGEGGTVGAVPAVMNAIADALAQRGKRVDFDMPATSQKLWRALHR